MTGNFGRNGTTSAWTVAASSYTGTILVGDSYTGTIRTDDSYAGDGKVAAIASVKCGHCGQWGARKCACKSCGAPID